MSGIYIHIPICATRCIYCDFYSTTLRHRAGELIAALEREMDERQEFLAEPVRTIYLGGGTPSQLGSHHVRSILEALARHFDLGQCHEVTLEANPEDIASGLWQMGADHQLLPGDPLPVSINRISMGVQSMVDDELRLLHRRHDSKAVEQAVHLVRQAGIHNLSLDLMYGLPNQTLDTWQYTIDRILSLRPEHISAYNLMVEDGTVLAALVDRGELHPADDETCLQMASILRQRLKEAGYQQYEISNYALPGYHSRHNSSYWQPTPYLGLGPGAHSYDGHRCRTSNAPDLRAYLNGTRNEDVELLTDTDLYNEFLMLGLRTSRGVDLSRLLALRHPLSAEPLQPLISSLMERGLVRQFSDPASLSSASPSSVRPTANATHSRLALTESGLALADEVIRELMA